MSGKAGQAPQCLWRTRRSCCSLSPPLQSRRGSREQSSRHRATCGIPQKGPRLFPQGRSWRSALRRSGPEPRHRRASRSRVPPPPRGRACADATSRSRPARPSVSRANHLGVVRRSTPRVTARSPPRSPPAGRRRGPRSPCLIAFLLERRFPAGLRGPVLFSALRRLAWSCFLEAMRHPLWSTTSRILAK